MVHDSLSFELQHRSDDELHEETLHATQKEKESTVLLLYHLFEVHRRKLYAKKGYGSLWSYVQEALHYSETQTAERISAMKLMFRDEEAKEAIETGKITLTQAAMTERFLRLEEKERNVPISRSEVRTLIEEVKGKSKRETEKILLTIRPKEEPPEKIRQVTETVSELRFPVSEEVRKEMERYWEIHGHSSVAELFSSCLTFYLDQKDPMKKKETKPGTPRKFPASFLSLKPSPTLPAKFAKPSRYISVAVKQEVRRRSEERCEYVDPETTRRCESRYLLQFDHIHPYALGGSSDLTNIRRLCAAHNGYLAERMFAKESTASYGGKFHLAGGRFIHNVDKLTSH